MRDLRWSATVVMSLVLSACAAEEESSLEYAKFSPDGLRRTVIARMYQKTNWTILAADGYRPDLYPRIEDRRIHYVCDAIAPLKPTYVSGLVRLDADQVIDDTMVEIWNGVRSCISGRVNHKVRFDVVLNAQHYTAEFEGVKTARKGAELLFRRLQSANDRLDPDGYFFDFYSTPWTDRDRKYHPDALLEGIRRIRGGDRFVAGNVWRGYVPKGSSFVSITDRGGRENVERGMDRLRGQGVPVLMHIRNDPHIDGSEGRRFIERDLAYRKRVLRRHVRWDSTGYQYMYPVFFPLGPGRVSYDALQDGLLGRIGEYMNGGSQAASLLRSDSDDAAPTPYDLDDDGLVGIHRAFNGGALQHLYSVSLFELEEADRLETEAEHYFALARSPAAGTTPLHRCYLGRGWHLLTPDAGCEGAAGATNEGAMGHIASSQLPGTVPLRRLFDPEAPDHLFTTSASERDYAVGLGYVDEGIAGYVWDESGFAEAESERVPIHRAYQAVAQQHLYSLSLGEIAGGAGLTLEAAGYFYLDRWPAAGTVPFHRCYLGDGWHLLTTQAACEGASGAIDEGVLGHITSSQLPGTTPLYRMFKGGVPDHFYTVSAAERDHARTLGYVDEGVAGYVYLAP
jgi:hypothetical protein